MVEASGFEPLSEDIATSDSPSAVAVFRIRIPDCPSDRRPEMLATLDSLSGQ